ncbi:MAG TPA: hypothetical protein VK607_09160 [Kofleriaceae bacterium]|nr:hypothetical protein [Kofleriaceae bacterium]
MWSRAVILAAGLLGLAGGAGCDGCNDGGFDAAVPDSRPPGGTFSLSWTLSDQGSGQPVTCDKLDPNATVFVKVSREGTGGLESFSCRGMQATSAARFAPGLYNFTFELHIPAPSGQPLTIATASAQNAVAIPSAQDVALAPVAFQVNATGMLQIQLAAGAGANCAGGAGITGFQISLEHAGGPDDAGCAPVVLALSGGGTYNANNCSAPVVGRCIESSETLTVASLPSGPYQIHVTGKKANMNCWSNNDTLRVPPQGMVFSQTLNLALASQTPGCP